MPLSPLYPLKGTIGTNKRETKSGVNSPSYGEVGMIKSNPIRLLYN